MTISPAYTAAMAALSSAGMNMPAAVKPRPVPVAPILSDEQQAMVDAALDGHDVIVDACIGSGKTTAIQELCSKASADRKVLYLTYSKLLKADAQRRVNGAWVQNYHGVVYPSLRKAGISCGIGESIRSFNESFRDLSAGFPRYDMLVVDEYQDITEEYAELLENIKSLNPLMQTVFVGDMAQKVRSDTTLDAQRFARSFCDDPELLPFTRSFRMGDHLGSLLGSAWNKPITGANTGQSVVSMDWDAAMDYILASDPGDLLCLGRRNGPMSTALNTAELVKPDVFNKNTVYASIRDSDARMSYGDDTAVFTTFDSSKGLERKKAVVFDFDEHNWLQRLDFPNADPKVLRNVFLVAASRGKDEVVFVEGEYGRGTGKRIGFIPVSGFRHLPGAEPPVYTQPFPASGCFDFTYAENLRDCVDRLDRERLDDGTGEEIAIDNADGLIDLSPAIGHYQEALFFDSYDAKAEILKSTGALVDGLRKKITGDPWKDSLVLAAADTEQLRYVKQVDRRIDDATAGKLVERLSSRLDSGCPAQVQSSMAGLAKSRKAGTGISFSGVVDAVEGKTVYELKFVTELSHAMFCQLALYLVMTGAREGVLWNTRTDERWAVRVPDRKRFMNAVVTCVTKQAYRTFEQQ